MKNGMLIWMNQGPTLQGDFLSLAIIEGKPELSFNLGKKTQPVRISSEVNTYLKAEKIYKKLMAYSGLETSNRKILKQNLKIVVEFRTRAAEYKLMYSFTVVFSGVRNST